MEIEVLEVIDFLKSTLPLNNATQEQLASLANEIEIGYRKRNYALTRKPQFLYLIRKGAVQIEDDNERLFAMFGEGDWFGCNTQLVLYQHICKEDTLYYRIPKKYFFELFSEQSEIGNFFLENSFLVSPKDKNTTQQNLLDSSVLSMSKANNAYLVDKQTSVNQVAELMTQHHVTSVMITHQQKLCGIVTDRAFCTKVVAQNIDHASPVENIMTSNPISIAHYKSGMEAMLLMANAQIRHLPIVKNKQVVGVVTAADLLRKQSHNVVFLINEIHCATTLEQLVKISKQVPLLLVNTLDSNVDEHDIAYSISSIGRAINQQLLKQAEEHFGQAPVPYAWVVAGSLARSEQIIHSDQDNLLIINDDFQPKIHSDYFVKLANYVCDGLNACGYVYCPGNVMATNQKWRQPLSVWKSYFNQWIESPEPKALMYASIFFDMKCIYGDSFLLKSLLSGMLEKTRKNTIFQSYMANNAQNYQPPLGFFRHFILDKNGLNHKALNLKKRGVVPIIDFARVYALSSAISVVNTEDRLRELIDQKGLSSSGGKDLIEAYKFINFVRIKHQAYQIKAARDVDNYVLPEEISSLDKKHLKDAFHIVEQMQSAMASQYSTALL